ncbi:MAG: TIR domain-containing protein, partial [Anaerolineae bacterium]|nr:TIR domain-containing protein [Anaerolineae bacterium]
MPETIFISYRSLDSAKVDPIVSRLRALENPDGTRRYRVWQDKNRDGDGIPPGADWWESIVDAIIECRVFIFMMSAESVKNDNCRAELSYAYARNRHILPIVLNGEFFYNASGKEDIRYMKDVPQELQDLRTQFLFDTGQQAYLQLEAVLADWMMNPRPDANIPYPKDPSQDDNNDYVLLYDEACDFAWRLEFEKAERKFRLLIRRTGHGFNHEAYQWLDILVKYKDLIRCDELKATRHR